MITSDSYAFTREDAVCEEVRLYRFFSYVGQALHVARVTSGMTQEQVAGKLGRRLTRNVSQSYISKLEKGRITISLRRFAAMCEVLQWRPSKVVATAEGLARDARRPEKEVLLEAQRLVEARLSELDCPSDSSGG